jgi:hypothetical protein
MAMIKDTSKRLETNFLQGARRKYHNKTVTVIRNSDDLFTLNVDNYRGKDADKPCVSHASRLGVRQSQMYMSKETLEAFVMNAMYVLGLDTNSVIFKPDRHKKSKVVNIQKTGAYLAETGKQISVEDVYKLPIREYDASALIFLSPHISFDCGLSIVFERDSDMGASANFDLEHIGMQDFEGLEFDLSDDKFFRKIEGYGIELIPTNGHSVKIPGYAVVDGYYSCNLYMELRKDYELFSGQLVESYMLNECCETNYIDSQNDDWGYDD